jgi:hypothetical protein
VVGSPGLFTRFVDGVERLMRMARFPLVSFLASVFNPLIEDAAGLNPVDVFRWCNVNLELSNHRGDVAESDVWLERSGIVEEQAVKQRGGRDVKAWLANHGLVAACHNRFEFEPVAVTAFEASVSRFDRLFLEQTEGIDGAVDRSLGAMYGTLAQHYGFCGPSWLHRTVACAEKAIARFGGVYGKPAPREGREDVLRQYNYLTCAFLDAGDAIEAERHLLLYLEQPSVGAVIARLDNVSEWELALIARFMADTGESRHVMDCVAFVRKAFPGLVCDRHPWQLCCLNLARCALKTGDAPLARALARQSLAICTSKNAGATMNTMALLPLAFLWSHAPEARDDVLPLARNAARIAHALNPAFFEEFEHSSPDQILQRIHTTPEAFFPFSYR